MVVSPQAEQIIDYRAQGNGALGSKAMKCTDHYSYPTTHTHPKSRRMSHHWKLRSQLHTLANSLSWSLAKEKGKKVCHGNGV